MRIGRHINTGPISRPMATPEATFDYQSTHADTFARAYFRRAGDCVVSSIGLGTRPGEPTRAVDEAYKSVVETAVDSGCNIIYSAPADRHTRSQRAVGRALSETTVPRERLFIAAAGGRIPFDRERPTDPTNWIKREYVETGLIDPADLAHGSHAVTPAFLAEQVDRSRENLEVETLDAFLIETPEVHLDQRSRSAVYDALEAAFERFERRVGTGDIRAYGISTWDAFRVAPDHDRYLSLPELVSRARAAADRAGQDVTHFRYIAVPFNIQMADAFTVAAHPGPDGEQSALWFAADAGIDVFATTPLAGGELTKREAIPAEVQKRVAGESAAQQALNFARSAPGVTSAIVGSSDPSHMTENIDAGRKPPMGADAFDATFRSQ